MLEWLLSLFRRATMKCDGCNKQFPDDELGACSGDAWLCDKCYKKYIGGP